MPDHVKEQRLDISFRSQADFWLYCVTESIEPRLVVDFEAEACVVIRDRHKFARRLAAAASKATGPAELRQGNANYVDPLIPKSPKIFAPLAKPFAYTYQAEYRFCWLAQPPVKTVQPIDLELGPLHDIAELFLI